MAVEKSFQNLVSLLRRLRDHLLALQLTVREDLPAEGGVVLVDRFGDAVDDLIGSLEEALEAAIQAQRALVSPLKWHIALLGLTNCQEHFHALELRFQTELVSYEPIKELTAFGRRRGGEWLAWVKGARQGVEQCKQPIEEVNRALLACWQELAARAGANSTSMPPDDIDTPACVETEQLAPYGSS